MGVGECVYGKGFSVFVGECACVWEGFSVCVLARVCMGRVSVCSLVCVCMGGGFSVCAGRVCVCMGGV